MRVSPTPQPPRTPRERLLGGYCQTSYIVFHEKKKKLKKLQRKYQEGARFHRLPDSCCARSDIQQLQAFYQQTASLYCFLHCWLLKVEVLPYQELTMRCFVYFRSKEAVEEKLSSTLYPFASQRTASGAMSSNLGTWHKVVVTLGHTFCRDFVILRLHLPHILHTDNTK